MQLSPIQCQDPNQTLMRTGVRSLVGFKHTGPNALISSNGITIGTPKCVQRNMSLTDLFVIIITCPSAASSLSSLLSKKRVSNETFYILISK